VNFGRFAIAAGGAACALSLITPARADCRSSPWRGSLERSPTIQLAQTMRSGTCLVSYRGGLNVTYESLSFIQRPQHLRITPGSNGYSFRLNILGGYKGKDAYTVRLCGRNNLGNGCITLVYDVTIL
jgi:hypothetical protein